jgi:hypothetical protein
MNSPNAVTRFASLIERHLAPIEQVQNFARDRGFAAWQVFVEERLKLVDEQVRATELGTLLLSCREEFCNFARYSRNAGGDAFALAELEELRERVQTRTGGYLLTSDALMYADHAVARRYARVTAERASTQLAVERGRYVLSALSMIDAEPGLSLGDLAGLVLRQQFGASGFSQQAASSGSACFKKQLDASAAVLVCLDDLPRLGNVGWFGDVNLSFFVRVDDRLKDAYLPSCCRSTPGLPLRIRRLAPGLEAYTKGTYLLPSQTSAADDTIVLRVYEAIPTSSQDIALVLGHLAMAVECHLTFFRAVEDGLAAACTEFRRSG